DSQGATNFYWQMGSISVTVTGGCGGGCAYRMGSTDSADWNAGTSSVVIAPSTAGVLRPANLTVKEWNTVQLKTTSGGMTWTLENNGPNWGALTLNAFNGTPILDTGNFNTTLGSYGPNVSGGTLTAGSSTITMSGNFDASVGAFTRGTSTVV